jgi:hypothetical protein
MLKQQPARRNEMRHLIPLGMIGTVFCVSLAANQAMAAEKKPANPIKVLEATYGGNCEGIAKGNVTQFVASKCNNTDLCNYRVYYKTMGGDPAAGCEKDFSVSYSCGRKTKAETCKLPAEAGMGGEDGQANHFCLLHCLGTADQSGNGSRAKASAPPQSQVQGQALVPRDTREPFYQSRGFGQPFFSGHRW